MFLAYLNIGGAIIDLLILKSPQGVLKRVGAARYCRCKLVRVEEDKHFILGLICILALIVLHDVQNGS